VGFLKVTPDQSGQAPQKVGPEWAGQWAGSLSDQVLAFASHRTTHDDRIGC
jgi:hypothetical protein